MCGILCILDKSFVPGATASTGIDVVVNAMLSTLDKRGPDEAHHQQHGAARLGHTRLSIIDLHTGSQPMYNEDGEVGAIFNGEIYNFRELRADLQRRGHTFRTQSDTEVIVHLYEEYGEGLFAHLLGMFALVVFDRRSETLLAGRDRMGQKPLLYHETDQHLLIASELKTLLIWPGIAKDLDPDALALYLNCMYVPAPLTIFRGILKLQPAHFLKRQGGRLSLHRYWEPQLRVDWSMSEADAVAGFTELFADAVQKRLVADVPLGVFLSGGIDSSAVTAFAAQAAPGQLRTYSIGLDEGMDERPFARMVAERCGTQHTELHARLDVAASFPLVMDYFDEPFADSSALPTYLVAREARAHVKTVLTGDGGDELFAGYEAYINQKHLRGTHLGTRAHRLLSLVRGRDADYARREGPWPLQHWRQVRSIVPADEIPRWLGSGGLDVNAFFDRQRWLQMSDSDALSVAFGHDLNYYLPDDLLKKVDMASMLTSLECRSPFLDHRLVEFCCRIPPTLKLQNDSLKHLLKQALADRLPHEVLHRSKHGFGAPVSRWVQGPLRELAHDLIRPGCRCEEWLDSALVRGLSKRMWDGTADADWRLPQQYWGLLALEWWLRCYL